MCCRWWHFCYRSLLATLRKKVGEPKEEIRNLYGFYMNSSEVNSYVWLHITYEFIQSMHSYKTNIFPPLSIKVISMGTIQLAVAGEDGWWQQISSSLSECWFFLTADFGCVTKKSYAPKIEQDSMSNFCWQGSHTRPLEASRCRFYCW